MGGHRTGGRTALVVVVLAVGLVAGCGGEALPDIVSDPSVPGVAWARTPAGGEVLGGSGGQGMKAVAPGGPGLVAVGTETLGDDAHAAVWVSADGVAWSRVPHDEVNLGGSEAEAMRAVVAGGPGLVAVGSVSRGADSDAAVWTSVDGVAWSRVPHDEAVFGGDRRQVMNAVVAGGPGLVAVGYDEAGTGSDDTGGRGTDAAVWTSVDGVTWSRVADDGGVFGGENSRVITAVVAGGPGLVAVGYDSASQGWAGLDANAAVWTSPDGAAWTRVPNAEVFGDRLWQMMNGVTVGGPGLVAVGYDGPVNDYDAAVWTSPDGLTWSRVPHDEAVFGGSDVQGMNAVTVGGPGLVAVGYNRTRGGFDAAAWVSADGATWARVPHDRLVLGGFGSQTMAAVVAAGPGLVAVGHSMAMLGWVPRDSDAEVWVSPVPSSSDG